MARNNGIDELFEIVGHTSFIIKQVYGNKRVYPNIKPMPLFTRRYFKKALREAYQFMEDHYGAIYDERVIVEQELEATNCAYEKTLKFHRNGSWIRDYFKL